MSVDAPSGDSTVAAVGPSRFVRLAIRPMSKVLNPAIGRFAGRRHFAMAGRIQHVGRRSGRTYSTSARIVVDGDIALIPLTFGNMSDWVRNVRASGGCVVHADGSTYQAQRPQLLSPTAPVVRAVFGPGERAGFRLLGVQQFLQLQVVAS